jgi:hypothetical protein
MSPYRLALFVHIVGMIGFFMALGVWLYGLVALRRARHAQQVRLMARSQPRFSGASPIQSWARVLP